MILTTNYDAWSSGQISSKIWLCEKLEHFNSYSRPVTWIYGGWYALTAFLLLSRDRLRPRHIRSFDIDPEVEKIADLVNENWVWQEWQFKAFTRDVNQIRFSDKNTEFGPAPQIVINTATEHFGCDDWFFSLPQQTLIALQGTNQNHPEEDVRPLTSLATMKERFPLQKVLFAETLSFHYPDQQFERHMLIGFN